MRVDMLLIIGALVAFLMPDTAQAARYGLMSAQKPLGTISVVQTTATADACGQLCYDNACPALVYTSAGNCTCISVVTGYRNTKTGEQGYVTVDDAITSCLNSTQGQQIIKDSVYGTNDCPSGFGLTAAGDYCSTTAKNQAECENYGSWYSNYESATGECTVLIKAD
ncbi:hypothetical protein AAVH_37450, partial [Aphelenchoides avenae]